MSNVSICKIIIKNFRSIGLIEAKISPLTILCGKNDVGKSNVLRAFNLFFNGQTNHGVEFDFVNDFNFNAKIAGNKAREIIITLEISLPESYHKNNGELIRWRKRWRQDGLHGGEADIEGVRLSKTKRGTIRREAVEISNSSNAPKLLRRIEFDYVPAVKGARYFDDLRGRIYQTIAEVATQSIRDTSADFESSIGEHLQELTNNINASLGLDTNLALPRDLSHIFERLDFLSGAHRVSLENRGDGIKTRHIPLILKFMAEKKAALGGRGSIPKTFIWGYEEPENNLELSGASALANEIAQMAQDGVAQILLTTHSPAFYDLAKQDEKTRLLQTIRISDDIGTKVKEGADGLDESLGILDAMSDRLEEVRKEAEAREKAKAVAQALAEKNMPTVFVEGESDRIVLRRGIELVFPALIDKVRLETKPNGAGHSYVIDMLNAWHAQHKHHPEGPRAVGILDGDARSEKKAFNEVPEITRSAKCFLYPTPQHLQSALQKRVRVPIDLEALYPREVWEYAKKHSALEKRKSPWELFPDTFIRDVFTGRKKLDDYLEDDWKVYVTHKFKSDKKIPFANHLAGKPDDEGKELLAAFSPLLTEVFIYLGLVAEQERNAHERKRPARP